jgi:hypothetical protein
MSKKPEDQAYFTVKKSEWEKLSKKSKMALTEMVRKILQGRRQEKFKGRAR